MRVFISSTCRDLLDLRAELFEDLRHEGLSPMASEIPESEFLVDGVSAPIAACLANASACDIYLGILSEQYGYTLKSHPLYEGKSVTHAEYLEARRNNRRRYVYVRAALRGQYEAWKQAGSDSAHPRLDLFTFVEDAQADWCETFTTSVDLKQMVRARLFRDISSAKLAKLVLGRQIPFFVLEFSGWNGQTNTSSNAVLAFKNCGALPALNAKATVPGASTSSTRLAALMPGAQLGVEMTLMMMVAQRVILTYSSVEGHEIVEEWDVTMPTPGAHPSTRFVRRGFAQTGT